MRRRRAPFEGVATWMVVLCASCVASRANGALGATWLRAYVDDSGRTSGPRVRRIETAAIGGEGWSDAWDLESGSAEHVRHAYTGAEMNRMFARVPAAAPVVYTTPQRSWIDVGVSNEFDRKVLVEASDDDGESDGVDEKERHDGDEALREKKNKYFMGSVSASSLQHMLNKYGGTVDSAFETINRRLEIDPNNPVLWADLGNTHRIMAENKEAAECFAKALRIMKHPELYQLLGTCLVVTERTEEAIGIFKQGMETFPGDPASTFSLALVYLQLEQWHDAIVVLEALTRVNPTFAGGLANEHLLIARRQLQRESSGRIDAGVFVIFVVTLVALAWLQMSRHFQRVKKAHSRKQKRR